ncbi:short-chain dehydrogenase/reductase SDR [Streptomyces sparsogenes DSM 40356]|uniref:Short-chain dehydrogenase/reductase SDR n=1 Tax=Streptomyces sparsogenes DSM 40356 TaxID=1331668 RepID=A0A1R1SL26_9ACTN|nr:short-chain dehydrogenase/reductase SDR [Streptomyces sparsogenes DSM 40356]
MRERPQEGPPDQIAVAAREGGEVLHEGGGQRVPGEDLLPAYGATKRAVDSLTLSAAVTYGPEGIRVNAIAPGTTLTEMLHDWEAESPGVIERLNADTPLRRAADPDEIAQAAAWLLSDRASYVTGTVLRVDGGMLA